MPILEEWGPQWHTISERRSRGPLHFHVKLLGFLDGKFPQKLSRTRDPSRDDLIPFALQHRWPDFWT
jgi:hypothetical protein